MRVLIVGGGIGGLCLANRLLKAGIDVQVFERQPSPHEALAGYGIHIDPKGRKALQHCLLPGAWERFKEMSTSAGVRVHFWDTQLNLLAERNDAKITGKPEEQVERRGIGRLELRDILLEGLIGQDSTIIHWSKYFKNYDVLEDGRVRAHFADGTMEEGDVLVGADGGRSKVREQYLPHIQREDLGVVAIAGRYVLNDEKRNALPAYLTDGSLNNIVPFGKGWMFTSAWKSRPTEGLSEKQTCEDFVLWAYPVPKQGKPSNIDSLTASQLQNIALQGIEGWSPYVQTLVKDADLSTVKSILLRSMPHLEPWKASKITLMGDAIHSMTPMAGVGANTALRDAELLSQLLADAKRGSITILDAIASYEESMRQYSNAAVALSRRNAVAATSGGGMSRWMFRLLLKVAQALPAVMKATIGKAALY